MPAHPVAHADADARDHPMSGPHSDAARHRMRRHTEIVQHRNHRLRKSIQTGLHSQAELIQRQDGTDGELTGHVQKTAATAIDPAYTPPTMFERLVVEVN